MQTNNNRTFYFFGLRKVYLIIAIFALFNVILINFFLYDFRAPMASDSGEYNFTVARYLLRSGSPQMWCGFFAPFLYYRAFAKYFG